MTDVGRAVREFFDGYAKATNSLDLAFLGSAYAETFMFAGPKGVQAVKRDEFLKVVPKRKAFFKTIGLVASNIRAIEETRLDVDYTMIKVYWAMRFEREAGHPIVDDISATYILRAQDRSLQIVFQLDHQDLAKRAQDLGLLAHDG